MFKLFDNIFSGSLESCKCTLDARDSSTTSIHCPSFFCSLLKKIIILSSTNTYQEFELFDIKSLSKELTLLTERYYQFPLMFRTHCVLENFSINLSIFPFSLHLSINSLISLSFLRNSLRTPKIIAHTPPHGVSSNHIYYLLKTNSMTRTSA